MSREPTSFDKDTALEHSGPGTYRGAVAPDWLVGRGAHGGYLAAIALRALTAEAQAARGPEHPARSLTVHYVRPVEPGPVEVRASVEHAGKSLTTLSARLLQGSHVAALALAAYAAPLRGDAFDDLPMPTVDPPGGERRPSSPAGTAAPPFARRLVRSPRFGPAPLTGGDVPMETGGWTGLIESRPVDELSLAVICDAWFSAPHARLTLLTLTPTIDLTLHFRAPLPRTADHELCLAHFRSRLVRDGYFEEDGVVWTPDGTVLAQSRQLARLDA